MLALVVTVGFFAVIFLLAFAVVLISHEVIERRNRVETTALALAANFEGGPTILREDKVSSISPVAAILERFDFIRIVQTTTVQAGLDWPVGRTAAMMLLCGTLALAVLDRPWLPGLVQIILSVIAALLPYGYIVRKRRKRLERFEHQLPEAVDALCRALKAGHPFSAGMEIVAGEPYDPVSAEMRKALDEWKLGMTWFQALDNLSSRIPLTDVEIFVAAVKLHMRTGGRLGEVLGRLSESMRESVSLRGEIRSLAAHGRMTGATLTILPMVLAAILFYVNPAQMMLLFTNPYGKDAVIGACVCLVLAHIIIQKIVDIRI